MIDRLIARLAANTGGEQSLPEEQRESKMNKGEVKSVNAGIEK